MAIQLGHFIYENAGTGCLLSKYCHRGLGSPLTESTSRIQPDANFSDDPFCGEFAATWVEEAQNVKTKSARLIITRKQDGAGNLLPNLHPWTGRIVQTREPIFSTAKPCFIRIC
jgi:hypothetical protein